MSIAEVCRRWRQVAISLPQLWSDIYLRSPHGHEFLFADSWIPNWELSNDAVLNRALSQLAMTAQAPLSIHRISVGEPHFWWSHRLLSALLSQSRCWQDISIIIRLGNVSHFENQASHHEFPRLRKLELSFDSGMVSRAHIKFRRFLHNLPMLAELTLGRTGDFLSGLTITFRPSLAPWGQLRKLKLVKCRADTVLSIIPLLATGAMLELYKIRIGDTGLEIPVDMIHTAIGALVLNSCSNTFVSVLLDALTAPRLHSLLHMWGTAPRDWWMSNLMPSLSGLTGRSACTLTHLRIGIADCFPMGPCDQLLSLCQSECLRSLEVLEISSFSLAHLMVPELIERPDILPRLRVLGLKCKYSMPGEEKLLALRSGRPNLRTLRIVSPCRVVLSRRLFRVPQAPIRGLELLVSLTWD
ncbi:hypothetical protein C8F01DRAFT_1227981 [Mycena amicta]|nr:hypothetical protein C8F01DRAFT_1227981 [Mycena amicta]